MGVHEGHSFIVEAAVSVGGRNIKPGLNIHRFANRIPLLFEVGGRVGQGRLRRAAHVLPMTPTLSAQPPSLHTQTACPARRPPEPPACARAAATW